MFDNEIIFQNNWNTVKGKNNDPTWPRKWEKSKGGNEKELPNLSSLFKRQVRMESN